jgi:four helix bundle protein
MERSDAHEPASVPVAAIRSHRDLVAWQQAYALGLAIYPATSSFPDTERFGLATQLRRCAVSVASNIAEGYGRGSTHDYLRFLRIARGSLCELDTQLQFASDLGYLASTDGQSLAMLIQNTERVLAGLIRSIERTAR